RTAGIPGVSLCSSLLNNDRRECVVTPAAAPRFSEMRTMYRFTGPLLLALVAGWLTLPGTARADVKDEGGFFSKEAVEKANRRIAEVKEKHKKDLVIETYSEVPKELRADFKKDKA